jgi:hypothetical protein
MIKSKGQNRNRVEDVGVINQRKEKQKGKTLRNNAKHKNGQEQINARQANHLNTHR